MEKGPVCSSTRKNLMLFTGSFTKEKSLGIQGCGQSGQGQAHYERLLKAGGSTYDEIVRNAYGTSASYHKYLRELSSAESQLDRAILERVDNSEAVEEKLMAEAKQLEKFREKEVERVFF